MVAEDRAPGADTDRGITRLDRAATLLLASAALTVIAGLGWGGPLIDLRLLAELTARAVAAGQQGLPIGPAVLPVLASLRPADLWPLAGTAITLLLGWHVVSLVAEVLLLLADGLGWLRARWLQPLWRVLDLLDSGPLARPKRIVVAGALATQILARTAMASQATPLPMSDPPALVEESPTAGPDGPVRVVTDTGDRKEGPWLVHRVKRGDTLSGLARRYYGAEGHWVTLFRGNVGAVMGWADLGRGEPIRLTNPDYVLAGCDLEVVPVPGRLEVGPNGEVIYIVQRGDTLSEIAERFDVSLQDLWATNRGAVAPDGRVVEDPDLIWPEVRIQVRPLVSASAPNAEPAPAAAPAPEAASEPAPEASPAPQPPPTVPAPVIGAPTPVAPVVMPSPVATQTTPPVDVPAAAPSNPDVPDVPKPPLWPIVPLVVAAGVAGVAIAQHVRRRRLFETDLTFTDAGRVAAHPARIFQAQPAGDPAELAAAALVHLATAHGIADVQTVAVYRDPVEITVVLAVPAVARDRLRLLLPAGAATLARRVTAWLTADHDLAVRLENPRPDLLAAPHDEVPLLLSLGGLGDGRELLAGWEALGHLLVVSGPATDDAPVQLAATIAMLAACRGVDQLQLYTVCEADSPLAPLAALPQQRAVALAPQARQQMLAALERAIDAPREPEAPERVLVLGELASLDDDERAILARLLAHGPTHGLRVLAATTDLSVAGEAATAYPSRAVYAMPDEETSVRVLGSPDAAGLAADGGMLVRLGGRTALVEAYQLRVLDEDLAALLAAMSGGEEAATSTASAPPRAEPGPSVAPDAEPDVPEGVGGTVATNETVARQQTPPAVETPDRSVPKGTTGDGAGGSPHAVDSSVVTADSSRPDDKAGSVGTNGVVEVAESVVPPPHVARLLDSAEPGQLVLQCLGGLGLWLRDASGRARFVGPGSGPGQLPLTRSIDLLTYVAVHMAVGPPTGEVALSGVAESEVRAELWHEAASRPIVGITGRRLMDDLARIGLHPLVPPLHLEQGRIRLDEAGCLSDVGAFQHAVAAARGARGADGLAAAEAAVAAYGGALLEGVLPAGETDGDGTSPRSAAAARRGRPTGGPLLGWTEELPAQRIAGKLEALFREALGLLAARLRDAGRPEEALARAWEALRVGELVPPDDAERLALQVLESAAALHDEVRLRAEHGALEEHLLVSGLELSEHVQHRHEQLQQALRPGPAEQSASVNGSSSARRERALEQR